MAIGIVMARYGLPEPEAFDVLRRTSQRVHRKLRDLAEEIVYAGEVPPWTGRDEQATAAGRGPSS
jgi:AmiR/NasT family two-component response regulator